jgi:hypothetical protein
LLAKSESLVETANRLVLLSTVLEWSGIQVPEFSYAKSVKTRCPYADMYHLNASASKSMRLYPETNTGNCFSGCGTLTPVSVFAKLNDLPYRSSAHELLTRIGYKPKTFWEKWQEAVEPLVVLDREAYRDSLIEYCARESKGSWSTIQYTDEVSATFTRSLAVLDAACSDEDAVRWLFKAKSVMRALIGNQLSREISLI